MIQRRMLAKAMQKSSAGVSRLFYSQTNHHLFTTGDTSDTLTFSDGGSGREDKHSDDDISVDSRSLNGRKNVPMPEGIAGSSTRSSFRKPMNRY